MDTFVKRFQPEKYELWLQGKDFGPHPEDPNRVSAAPAPSENDIMCNKKFVIFLTATVKVLKVYSENLKCQRFLKLFPILFWFEHRLEQSVTGSFQELYHRILVIKVCVTQNQVIPQIDNFQSPEKPLNRLL